MPRFAVIPVDESGLSTLDALVEYCTDWVIAWEQPRDPETTPSLSRFAMTAAAMFDSFTPEQRCTQLTALRGALVTLARIRDYAYLTNDSEETLVLTETIAERQIRELNERVEVLETVLLAARAALRSADPLLS